MPHKDSDNFTIAPATRRSVRRVARPLHFESDSMQRKPQAQPQADAKRRGGDFVYAVKVEVRSPDTGHPLVEPPSLAVDEVYLTKEKAIEKMQVIVNSARAFEIARARTDPHNPAWVNIVCGMDSRTESWEVVRADGMILSYFVDKMPLM